MNLNEASMQGQPQPRAQQEQPQGQDQPKQEGGQAVDPKIQEQFDIFVANGMNIIHNPQVSDGILNRVFKNKNKIEAIAVAMVDIVTRLSESATGNGISLNNETLVHGSNFLLGELLGMAEAAGMQKLTNEQKTEAYQRAVGMYLDGAVKSGKMTQEQVISLGDQTKQTPEGQKIQQMGAM